jgi:hypothetical protein
VVSVSLPLLVDRELQLAHDLAQSLQGLFGFALPAQDHEVVGIATRSRRSTCVSCTRGRYSNVVTQWPLPPHRNAVIKIEDDPRDGGYEEYERDHC